MAQESKDKKINNLIVYVGTDKGYWDSITGRIKYLYPSQKFEFATIFEDDANKYPLMFEKVARLDPAIVFIDISYNTQSQLKLAQMLKRDPTTKPITQVGLIDDKELLHECIFTGFQIMHVKCGELHDVIYHPFKVTYPEIAVSQDFARAVFQGESQKTASLHEDFRVAYATPTGIHVESNFIWQKGDILELENSIPDKYVPSDKFTVAKVEEENLFYDYMRAYDLDYHYVDPPSEPELPEDADEGMLKKHKKECDLIKGQYKNELVMSKKKVRQWVEENMADNEAKETKILMLDWGMECLKTADKPLHKYPFVMRFKRTLAEDMRELDGVKPQIIAVEMDAQVIIDEEEDDLEDNIQVETDDDELEEVRLTSMELLEKVIEKITQMEKYRPFIIAYNSADDSPTLQEMFKYPFILANGESLNIPQLVSFAQVFEKKQKTKYEDAIRQKIQLLKKQNPMKYRSLTPRDFKPQRFYFRSSNDKSHAAFSYDIKILTMTESEMTFSTEAELELGLYRINVPINMAITLIPFDDGKPNNKQGMEYEYRALIHSIDENDKKKVRLFVNDNFFEGVKKERAKELEDFQNKNLEASKLREDKGNPSSGSAGSNPSSKGGGDSES